MDAAHTTGAFDGRWLAVEKIHGTNFGVKTLPDGTPFAMSRNRVLGSEAPWDFFDAAVASVWDHLSGAAMAIHAEHADDHVILYGELYGGWWPQKGVAYCPGNAFAAFDIVIDGEFWSWDRFTKLCKMFDIPMAPLVHDGTWEEVAAINNTFRTRVPSELHGLECGDENNVAEGLVLRPEHAMWLPNGKRLIFKNKSDQYAENASQAKTKGSVSPTVHTDRSRALYEVVAPLISKERFVNVVTKEHPLDELNGKQFGKYLGLLVSDAWQEYQSEVAEEEVQLETGERKALMRDLSSLGREIVLYYLKGGT
jgi:Rnl2 family RNA ligase